MSVLALAVQAFDPALPFRPIDIMLAGVDTWHERSLITRTLWTQLPTIPEIRPATLRLSGGMSIQAPLIALGITIGSIRLDRVECLVVDAGDFDVLLGSDAIEQAFQLSRSDTRVVSPWKDDAEALSIQFYPVDPWIEVHAVENVLSGPRRLYNILLFANGVLPLPRAEQIDAAVWHDEGIPHNLRLKLTWIESGSIWTTFKSASLTTLRYLAGMFETGATAKLAQEIADAQKAVTESEISQATRDATAARIVEEQDRLRYDNIASTYSTWRREVTERLAFADELLAQLHDPDAAAELRRQKDQAIVSVVSQNLLPMVRNVPHEVTRDKDKDRFLLPPPSDESG